MKVNETFSYPIAEGNLVPGHLLYEDPEYKPPVLRRRAGGNAEPIPIEDETAVEHGLPPPDAVGNDELGIDPSSAEDLWTRTSDVIIRHHRVPRTKLFLLSERHAQDRNGPGRSVGTGDKRHLDRQQK